MKQYLFLTSALVVSGLLSGVVEAACIQTPTCSSLGYTSSQSCSGGIKCPFGNAWNCTLINKITEIEKKVTEIINNGGGSSGSNTNNPKLSITAAAAPVQIQIMIFQVAKSAIFYIQI